MNAGASLHVPLATFPLPKDISGPTFGLNTNLQHVHNGLYFLRPEPHSKGDDVCPLLAQGRCQP